MARRSCLTILLVLSLCACSPAGTVAPTFTATMGGTPTHTVILLPPATSTPAITIPTNTIEEPSPTAEAAGPTASLAPEPTIEETVPPAPSPIPQTTAVSTAVPQPSANSGAIQIYSPGPQSKIVSPLNIYGYAIPGYQHKGRVVLYGEDGSILASEILQLNTVYKWAYFYWPLDFTISSAGELARLSLSTQDQYGRTTALYSVHVLLLSEGQSILYPPGDLTERCVISRPAAGQKPSGGTLAVRGTMVPFNTLPLTVELIGRDGSVMDSQLVPITPDGSAPVPFQVDLHYGLLRGAWGLLSVSQYDDRIGGVMYLYSQEIFLNP